MKTTEHQDKQRVLDHFAARSERYDRSSSWVGDERMGATVRDLIGLRAQDAVLDVACGTGRWARHFHGRARMVVGLDMTPEMYQQSRDHLDLLVHGSAEDMPFVDESFDVVVERQGIQFMDAPAAVREMVRVARKGGRVCLIQLCAYGQQDRDEYFEILALRNPARRNFFLREDLSELLLEAGCTTATVHDYISVENVDRWADNGAIAEDDRDQIRRCYDRASARFKALHAVRTEDGHHIDQMLFGVAIGVK